MNKPFTYSKGLPIVSGIIFVLCLAFGFTANLGTVYDTSVFVTAISVSGAIFGSICVWYNKKSASENQYKLRMGMYSTSIDERLRFNEEMLKLQQKYGVTSDDIENLDNFGEADDFMSSALNSVVDSLDSSQAEADSPNELQNFSL